MNKSDSEKIAAVLEKTGYKEASKINEADLVVVNMCSVRQSAVDRVYGLLPKFKKLKAKTILTGCVLRKDRRKFVKLFDEIVNIKDLIKDMEQEHSNKFSALVPIMSGCNNFCSYCVVPYVRGREISRPAEEIICEIKKLVKRGCKEIWLLGQNVNSYSTIPFPQLLKKINKIPGKFWIRFTSSHPKPSTRAKLGTGPVPYRNEVSGTGDFSWDELIKAMGDCEKVTEYLNLPVQAGDNKILKQMNRHYTVAQYKKLVEKIRKKIPDIFLSTDVIVGFPGETKEQFENTVKLFKEIKFDMAYINKFSPRTGTKTAKLKDNISPKEKDRRDKVLTEVLKQTALEHNKKYIGKTVEILVDKTKIGFLFGKTRTYKTVKVESKKKLLGQFIKVKITDALPWGLKGELK